MLNHKQVAKELGLSLPTIYSMRDAGQMPKQYPNPTVKRMGFKEEDIELYKACSNDIEEYRLIRGEAALSG